MGSLSQEGKIDSFASFSSVARSSLASSSNSSNSSSSSSSDAKYIEHTVSKLDTLAGIAIKYGVEVSDIKRINGLVTDIQMFAHKSLFIPLPGRHPPTPVIQSNDFGDNRDWSPARRPQKDVLDSLQSLKMKSHHQSGEISPAMSSLQRYYGLQQHQKGSTAEGTEMTVYRTCSSQYFEDELLSASDGQPTRYTGLVKSYLPENDDLFQNLLLSKSGDTNDGEIYKTDKSVRRRPKVDIDPLSTSEASVKDDNRGFIGRLGRALAPKALFSSEADIESARQNTRPAEEEASSLLSVRKSSSTSSLQESASDSIWASSRWTLKPDSVTRPIFSGLPKQINVWRSKAALD